MRIILVGMHNKPGKMPLCSSTKTGKLLNRILINFRGMEIIKSNLYDIDFLPIYADKRELSIDWHNRINPTPKDIIILLGAEVHKNFIKYLHLNTIKLAHPASKRSHESMDDYVLNAVAEINKIINN